MSSAEIQVFCNISVAFPFDLHFVGEASWASTSYKWENASFHWEIKTNYHSSDDLVLFTNKQLELVQNVWPLIIKRTLCSSIFVWNRWQKMVFNYQMYVGQTFDLSGKTILRDFFVWCLNSQKRRLLKV